MATVYLALGSNVGDGDQQFDRAIELLTPALSHIQQAPRYSSKAVGFTDQPDFLNTAIRAETDLDLRQLLELTQSVEQKVGRVKRFHWGPREIDIDIIFYDNHVIELPDLSIPHPRFSERDFVLRPLQDLSPEFVDPLTHKTVKALYDQLPLESRSIKG